MNRRIAFIISVLLLILCVLLNYFYRPYIYQRHIIFDFHFADAITSWFCIPCYTLFFWSVYGKIGFVKVLLSSFIGFLTYEFIGLTFDWHDVIALILSTLITYLFYLVFKRLKIWQN
jgi:hypothetical protein